MEDIFSLFIVPPFVPPKGGAFQLTGLTEAAHVRTSVGLKKFMGGNFRDFIVNHENNEI